MLGPIRFAFEPECLAPHRPSNTEGAVITGCELCSKRMRARNFDENQFAFFEFRFIVLRIVFEFPFALCGPGPLCDLIPNILETYPRR